MLFNCPQCGQALKAADDAAGKKCRCTRCSQLVVIPGSISNPTSTGNPRAIGPARSVRSTRPADPASPGASTKSSNATKSANATKSNNPTKPAKPASVAAELSDMIVRQQAQIKQDAARAFEQQEQARIATERRSKDTRNRYAKPKNSSPIRTVLSVVLVVTALVGILCCGVLGYFAVGQSVVLSTGGYSAIATGRGEIRSENRGTEQGQGIMNRLTGSEFWLYYGQVPAIDSAAQQLAMDKFGSLAKSQRPVQRGNLSGNRFSEVSLQNWNLPAGVRCEMEVFFHGDAMILTMYISGSSKAQAGHQRKSPLEGSEAYLDMPESFFESLASSP